MAATDIIALIITIVGVASFAAVVTILFRNFARSTIKEINLGTRDIELLDLALYEREPSVIRNKKTTEVIKNVLYYGFLAIVIPIFGLSIYSKIQNNVTQIGGNYVLVVASGSMSEKHKKNEDYLANYNNQFNTYDIIIVQPVSSEYDLNYYDVIAFKNDKGINVIHRILRSVVVDGETRFVTRGDANGADDAYQPKFSDIIGRYTNNRLPGIGIFVMFLQSYAGIITVVSVVYCSFMISHFNKKIEEANEKRKEMVTNAFESEGLSDDSAEEMNSGSLSYIYYKGYVYEFDENKFIQKREQVLEEKEQNTQQSETVEETDNNNI